MYKQFTKEEKKKIFEDYKNNIATRNLAKKYHTNTYNIKNILYEMGVDINNPNKTVGIKRMPSGYWSIRENNEALAKTCINKREFGKKSSAAYKIALKNGWIEEYEKLYFSDKKNFPSYNLPIHIVYSYEIKEFNSVYVGRTTDLKRRDKSHRNPVDNDTLYYFCKNNNVEIPKPIILEENLTAIESQEKEGEWVNTYQNSGWNVLNKQKTGIGKSSLGSTAPKWNYETCKVAASTCINKEEFKKKYSRAHNVSRANGWIDEFFPYNSKRNNGCFDTIEGCKEACKGFKTILDIRKHYPFLYHKISKNKWTEEIRKYIGEDDYARYNFILERKKLVYLDFNKSNNFKKEDLNTYETMFFNLINQPEYGRYAIIDKKSELGKRLFIRVDSINTVFLLINVKENSTWKNNIKNNEFASILDYCTINGIRLITIYDSELKYKTPIVVNKIRYFLKINKNFTIKNIYGRKSEIKEIDKNIAYTFLEKYHIQGFTSSTVYLGCYYEDELVAVMSFKNGGINRTGWELNRFASKPNYNYCGVGGKLFNYFIKKYNPDNVISFADKRWGIEENNIYTKNGFKYINTSAVSYQYFKYEKTNEPPILYHKLLFRKTKLVNTYGINEKFNNNRTESEMMKELNYDKIYDCGLIKYVWKNKE